VIDFANVGLTLDQLDLDEFDDDLSVLPLDRLRQRPAGWWTTTEAESHFLDLPHFTSSTHRARYFIAEAGRAALANIKGATADDRLFELDGRAASLNELLESIDRDVVDDLLDVLRRDVD